MSVFEGTFVLLVFIVCVWRFYLRDLAGFSFCLFTYFLCIALACSRTATHLVVLLAVECHQIVGYFVVIIINLLIISFDLSILRHDCLANS
jgi:hypothetical protein